MCMTLNMLDLQFFIVKINFQAEKCIYTPVLESTISSGVNTWLFVVDSKRVFKNSRYGIFAGQKFMHTPYRQRFRNSNLSL